VWALLTYGVVSAGVVAALLLMMRANAIDAGERLAGAFAQLTEQQTSPVIANAKQGLEETAERLAAATAAGTANEDTMRTVFRGILRDRPYFMKIRVLDAQGRNVFDSESGGIGMDLSDRPHFVRHRDRPGSGFGVDALFQSPSTGRSYIPATLALRSANGEFSGVIIGFIDPRYLEAAWSLDNQIPGLAIVLANEDGKLLMRVPYEARFDNTSFGGGPLVAQLRAGRDYGTQQIVGSFDKASRLLAFRRLAAFPELVVVVSQPMEGVLAAWWHSVWMTSLGWALGSAALAGLALWLVRAWSAKQAAEAQLRGLFDANPYPLYVTDRETRRLVAVSNEAVALFGWSRAELLTKTANDLYPPEDVSVAIARRKLFTTEENQVYRGLRHLKKDGTTFDSEIVARVIEYNGRTATLATVTDVTERLQAERARRAAEERNRNLFEYSPHPIYAVNRQSQRIVAVNDAAVALYGWSREELLAMTSNDLYPPEDLPGVIAQRKLTHADLNQTIRGRRHRKKDGTVIDIEMNVRLIDLDGQPTHLANIEDITAKNQADARRVVAEKWLRAVMDNTVDGLITIDQTGQILSLNKTAEDLFGYGEAEAIGQNVRIFMPEPFRSRHDGYLASYIKTGNARIIGIGREVVGVRRDGTEFPMDLAVNEVPDGSGQRHFVGTVRDVTKKRAIEDELSQSHAHYRLLFDSNPYATTVTDRETLRIVGVNPAAEQLYGWSQAEMLAMTADDFYLPEDAPAMRARRQAYLPDTSYKIPGKRHRTKAGRVIDVEMAARVIEYNGRPANLTIITDVTERLQMERARLAAEERYRQLFDANPYAIALIDRETQRFVAFNDATVDQYGWSREELRAMTADDLYLPEDMPAVTAERKLARPNVTRSSHGWRHRKKDGTIIHVDMSMRWIDVDGRPTCLAIIQDVTEKHQANIKRLAAERHLRAVMDNTVDGLITIDQTGEILSVNKAATTMFGYAEAELAGRAIGILMPEPYRSKHRDYLASYTTSRQAKIIGTRKELSGLRKDGTVFPIDLAVGEFPTAGNKSQFVGTVRDITQKNATEEQLRQSQKMEAVGQLTGGIAHDFNNILTIILANADALQDEEGLDAGVVDRLDKIAKAVERASDLTRSLLVYSRKQPLNPRPTNINDLVTITGQLLGRVLGEHIELNFVLAEDLWTTSIDRTQLETALVNLCVNARDAMPGGGRLLIETRNAELADGYLAPGQPLAAGEYALLTVTDTGTGMSPEIQAKVFEPFFTTKEVGKGTGLGLSMVYGFVGQSGGGIQIDSEIGHGTSFKLYFPRSNEGDQSAPVHEKRAPLPGGSEHILVVEDEPQVRASVVDQLKSLGYAVSDAADGAAGIETLEAMLLPFDLLLTDVVMPGLLDGKALADEAKRRWPGMKIVFMSGYTGDALSQGGQLDGDALLLTKPFRRADLAKIVRLALDGAGGPSRRMAPPV
jgi:PAS domain S-box-containing protein